MMMSAHALVAPPGEVRVWVGVFDAVDPGQLSVQVEGCPGVFISRTRLKPIRDGMADGAGRPLNRRCIVAVRNLPPATWVKVEIKCGSELQTVVGKTLPERLPAVMDGEFNILLSSCYSRPDDHVGVGSIVSRIKLRPDMTLLLGDQVYGDLPLWRNVPSGARGIARRIGDKYRDNFAPHEGSGGLKAVLSSAPVACVADDHEYWNNYPFPQAQIPATWLKADRLRWTRAAQALYANYQLDTMPGAVRRFRLDPLRVIILDTRTHRDDQFCNVLSPAGLREFRLWVEELLVERGAGRPAFGMVVSGQALMVEAERSQLKSKFVDAELANYGQVKDEIIPAFDRLTCAGIPLIYVTGDVHWSRVATARNVRTNRQALYEVIASPSCLIGGGTATSQVANGFLNLLGARIPWPGHGQVGGLPRQLRERGDLVPEQRSPDEPSASRRGDHVAVLSLARAGQGIDFRVTYFGISDDVALQQSASTRTYSLRNA
jgi:hypothetical protein